MAARALALAAAERLLSVDRGIVAHGSALPSWEGLGVWEDVGRRLASILLEPCVSSLQVPCSQAKGGTLLDVGGAFVGIGGMEAHRIPMEELVCAAV